MVHCQHRDLVSNFYGNFTIREIKVLSILTYTFISLAVFAREGKVGWTFGLVLGAGTMVGSRIGVHMPLLKGHRWIKKVVILVVIIMTVKLIFS